MIILGSLVLILPMMLCMWLYRSSKAASRRTRVAALSAAGLEAVQQRVQAEVDAYFNAHPTERLAPGLPPHPNAVAHFRRLTSR